MLLNINWDNGDPIVDPKEQVWYAFNIKWDKGDSILDPKEQVLYAFKYKLG